MTIKLILVAIILVFVTDCAYGHYNNWYTQCYDHDQCVKGWFCGSHHHCEQCQAPRDPKKGQIPKGVKVRTIGDERGCTIKILEISPDHLNKINMKIRMAVDRVKRAQAIMIRDVNKALTILTSTAVDWIG